MCIRFLFLSVLFFSIIACNNQSNTSEKKGGLEKDSTAHSENTLPEKGGEITERGVLKAVEDSGYPFAVITIEFPERKFFEYFTINVEEVDNASPDKLNSYVGKYITFNYTSEILNALLDLQIEGKSILGMDSPPDMPEIKVIEGILDGATEETAGDIPGEVSIMAYDGEKLFFEFFVTAEMVEVNGKRVKVIYDTRTMNNIKSIKLSGN